MDLLKTTNVMLLPLELLIHVASFIPNETFNLSKVCKLWVKVVNKKQLTEIMTNKKIKKDDAYEIINNLRNDSYAMSQYIKKFKIIGHVNIRTIYSPKCLDILTWHMLYSKLNEPKKCENCKSFLCAGGDKYHRRILEQYCVVDGTTSYAEEVLKTIKSYDHVSNKKFDKLGNICLKNKSCNMEKWIQLQKLVKIN